MAVLAIARGDFAEAEQQLVRAVETARKSENSDRAIVPPLWHLGWILRQSGDQARSDATCREALTISTKHGAYGAWPLLHGIYDLTDILQTQGKFAEAEPLLLEAAEYVQNNSAGRTLQREAFHHLVRFYEACGKNAEAADCRKKLEGLNERASAK